MSDEDQEPQSDSISPGDIAREIMRDIRFAASRNSKKKVEQFEVIDHGIDHAQYFQGCGAGGYDEVATGVGECAHEAMEDALKQLASNSWNVDKIPNEFDPNSTDTVTNHIGDQYHPELSDEQESELEAIENELDRNAKRKEMEDEAFSEMMGEGEIELYYYVSVRVSHLPEE